MIGRRMRVVAQRALGFDHIDLHVIREDFTAMPVVVEALTADLGGRHGNPHFVEIDEGSLPPFPAIRLHNDAAQNLMDSLYRAGFRPFDGKATAGELEAVKAHLEDMRRSYELVLKASQ